ncbi:MAG: VOC family protein [Saprospiraceae bacterium]|nr:VOC family protein [Saprospiraceae bacterium]
MPTKDRERVSKFYSETFGWNMIPMGEDMGNYIMAHTADTDEKGMIAQPGAINGGFYESKEENEPPHLVIVVDNVDEHIELVKNAGGEVLGEPMDIPGVGRFVMIKDTEGNKVAILQPASME